MGGGVSFKFILKITRMNTSVHFHVNMSGGANIIFLLTVPVNH